MTREEFERTVRAMRAEGVPLSMPNLMVRTELPRSTIEDWLEEMDAAKAPAAQDRKGARKAAPAKATLVEDDDLASELMKKVSDLKSDLVRGAAATVAAEAVKEKLGLDDDEEERAVATAPKAQKDLRIGAGLGFFFGPLGLAYSAPWKVAVPASVGYLLGVVLLSKIPILGTGFIAYLVPLIHIASTFVGAAYTWRFNRKGRREALLPEEPKAPGRSKR